MEDEAEWLGIHGWLFGKSSEDEALEEELFGKSSEEVALSPIKEVSLVGGEPGSSTDGAHVSVTQAAPMEPSSSSHDARVHAAAVSTDQATKVTPSELNKYFDRLIRKQKMPTSITYEVAVAGQLIEHNEKLEVAMRTCGPWQQTLCSRSVFRDAMITFAF